MGCPGHSPADYCQLLPGEEAWELTSSSGPRVDTTGISVSGLLLSWFHRLRAKVRVICQARGLGWQDVLGEPFVEPGSRPLPDLEETQMLKNQGAEQATGSAQCP